MSEGVKENTASRIRFLGELKERGLKGVELYVSDRCLGLVDNVAEFYPDTNWQCCVVRLYSNMRTAVPTGSV